MCRAPLLPQEQRRHRAAYVAPSADLYPETASLGAADDDDTVASLIPLLVEVPPQPVSPPSSADWLDLEGLLDEEDNAANITNNSNSSSSRVIIQWKLRLIHSLKACYRWSVDILIVMVMCVLGCFVYDVEVRMVKQQPSSSDAHYRRRRRRVIVRNDDEGAARPRWRRRRRRQQQQQPPPPPSRQQQQQQRQRRPITSLLRSPWNNGEEDHYRAHQPWGYV